jgi:hypothetical protein
MSAPHLPHDAQRARLRNGENVVFDCFAPQI